MNKDLMELLKFEVEEIKRASRILKISYNECKKIGIRKDYEDEELLQFEGLTSRFSRLSDIIIQKVLRTVINLELERFDSTRDLLNLSEKKNIIHDAHKMAESREIRNKIVHEYILENFETMFKDVLTLTPYLLEDVKLILDYCNKKYDI